MKNLTLGVMMCAGVLTGQTALGLGDSRMGVRSVALSCDGELANQSCAAFEAEMTRVFPQHGFARAPVANADLEIVLRMTWMSTRSLKGQISWDGPNEGQGPEMTSGVSDGRIDQRQLTDLIKDQITQTLLPL